MNGLRSVSWTLALLLAGLVSACHREIKLSTESVIAGYPAWIEVGEEHGEQLAPAANFAFGVMTATMETLDPERPDSDLNKLNRVANTVRLQVSRNTFRLLDLIHHYSGLTAGTIDPTVYPLEKAWGLHGKAPEEEPSPELLEALRIGVGRDFVELFDQGAVAFTSPNTQIHLGRFGTAYAVDLAALDLRRRGYSSVHVQLDGFQRVLGMRSAAKAWVAPVSHPFLDTAFTGFLTLEGTHTSLTVLRLYDQPLNVGDHIYGGILDPRNGRPAEGTALVAVTGPSATMAAALAQALLVAGLKGAPALLSAFPKCEALVIPDQQPEELWMTSGWQERFTVTADSTNQQHTLERAATPADGDEPATPAPES